MVAIIITHYRQNCHVYENCEFFSQIDTVQMMTTQELAAKPTYRLLQSPTEVSCTTLKTPPRPPA